MKLTKELLNQPQPVFKTAPGRLSPLKIVTCSAMAAVLCLAPIGYDVERGEVTYNSAWAKSCFVGTTRILMADGSYRLIKDIRPNDHVMGEQGRINRVREVECVPLAGRALYRLNGSDAFVTAEHPFRTPTGWASISPIATAHENPNLKVSALKAGDRVMRLRSLNEVAPASADGLAHALELFPELEEVVLESIEAIESDSSETVFNLLLDGNNTYIADDYLVHNKGGDSGSDSGGSDSSGSGSGGSDSSGSDSGGSSDDDDRSGSSGSDSDDDDDRSGSSGDDSDDSDSWDSDRDDDSDRSGSDDSDDDSSKRRGSGLSDDDFNEAGLKLRGDGSIDDTQPGRGGLSDDFNDLGQKLRGDGTVDDSQPGIARSSNDDLNASGQKLRGDGTVDDTQPGSIRSNDSGLDSGSSLSLEQERAAIESGWK